MYNIGEFNKNDDHKCVVVFCDKIYDYIWQDFFCLNFFQMKFQNLVN